MEQWVRVQNERDRQVLAWLRAHVGDLAIIDAAGQCGVATAKPYLSAICRKLGVAPPRAAFAAFQPGQVGEQHLAYIYQILQRPKAPLRPRQDMHLR